MDFYYSPSNGGFYTSLHSVRPADAVRLTAAEHSALIAGQGAGLAIQPGPDGQPVLVERTQSALPVPTAITMRQARLCLHRHGMLDGIQPAIDALPEPDRTAAQIEWDFSSAVERHRGFVAVIAQSLGLTDEQIDALFTEASTL